MTNVYVVHAGEYAQAYVVGIYSTLAKAAEVYSRPPAHFAIEVVELDKCGSGEFLEQILP